MKLLLISLGKLTGALLESAARDGRFSHITVASRNAEYGRAKVNAVRIGAALEGEYPQIDFVPFDLNAANAGEVLKRIAPDIAFAAPSLMPWWRLDQQTDPKVRAIPFAGWMACHLAPMLKLRDAWAKSELHCPWVAASYPDVVNAVLHLTGIGPSAGSGNVAECVPKIRFLAAQQAKAPPKEIEVRLVAQHALEYFLYGDAPAKDWPPFLLKITWHGHDITLAVRDRLKTKMPIPYDLDFNRITASATLDLLAALTGDQTVSLHAPAPNGLLGGYPVQVSRRGIVVDLPPEWDLERAIGVNAASLAFDGIATLDKAGTVTFTDKTAAALKALLGERIETLKPETADAMAAKLVAAVTSPSR